MEIYVHVVPKSSQCIWCKQTIEGRGVTIEGKYDNGSGQMVSQ